MALSAQAKMWRFYFNTALNIYLIITDLSQPRNFICSITTRLQICIQCANFWG